MTQVEPLPDEPASKVDIVDKAAQSAEAEKLRGVAADPAIAVLAAVEMSVAESKELEHAELRLKVGAEQVVITIGPDGKATSFEQIPEVPDRVKVRVPLAEDDEPDPKNRV